MGRGEGGDCLQGTLLPAAAAAAAAGGQGVDGGRGRWGEREGEWRIVGKGREGRVFMAAPRMFLLNFRVLYCSETP